jgi:hypothetical protein
LEGGKFGRVTSVLAFGTGPDFADAGIVSAEAFGNVAGFVGVLSSILYSFGGGDVDLARDISALLNNFP